ncbi:MAG: hypothetical protein PHV78_01730 [Patescibacteria group bacterium]|nr:hypothetical protein [Patescibacteria group bacterium]MDD5121129.1 hypothetical protein [Patescibacteria group bacterium]MDD5221644.1 hypothetical protein [Patescibacteria group bacterium]MDD5395952.1 hypothetical protein [Patescibacteria group bacterium]
MNIKMPSEQALEQKIQEVEKTVQEVERDVVERVLPIEFKGQSVGIDEWRKTIQANFPELFFPAEVGLSVIAQLLIKDISNPFGMVYVDVPSSGKTITLNFFTEVEELVYATDNFTPASFVSHASNVKREDLKKIDLLPKIRYKLLIVRDLAPIFGAGEEDLQKNLSTLTRVFDGEGLQTDSGIHGQRGYCGDYVFMFLAASTPISPKVWKAMSSFGSRLFFLNMETKEKDDDTLAQQLTHNSCKEKETVCREKTGHFIRTLWHKYSDGVDWNKGNDSQELKKMIGKIAKLLAKLRGTIKVWEKSNLRDDENFDHQIPIIEKPDRINQCLYNLARGHALVCGREQIDERDVAVALEVALDSAISSRVQLFNALLDNNGQLTTDEAMDRINCSRVTALKEMEAFKILGLVDLKNEVMGIGRPEYVITLKEKFKWFLSGECKNIREPKVADTGVDLLN